MCSLPTCSNVCVPRRLVKSTVMRTAVYLEAIVHGGQSSGSAVRPLEAQERQQVHAARQQQLQEQVRLRQRRAQHAQRRRHPAARRLVKPMVLRP